MSKKSFIDSVEVKEPCSENWSDMSGNNAVRFCSHCSKNVNNLSEMTRKQAMRLVRSNPELCIRYIPNPRTQRPMFAAQLLQITRRTPSIAAGVMTASIALSTSAYGQETVPMASLPLLAERVLDRDQVARTESERSRESTSPVGIFGTVTDITGAVIQNAKVVAYSIAAGKTAETSSNDQGDYRFNNLPAGKYRIETSFEGFKLFSQEVAFDGSEPTKADAALAVGDFALTIEVKGETVELATGWGGAMTAVSYRSELSSAVADEDSDKVREAINRGADVNEKEPSYDKITPLFIAVETGNVEIVKLLLDHGAKINARDSEKQTPLMRLDEDATPELVDLLVNRGAKIDLADKSGNTALIIAAESVPASVIAKLIGAGADVNSANKEGQTALMNAANADDLESVRELLTSGAKVNAKNEDGETAWDLATEDEVVKLIEMYGGVSGKPD